MKLNNMDANRPRGPYGCESAVVATIPTGYPFAPQTTRRIRPFLRSTTGRGQHGLTLVELIVTIAILAILASVAYPIARFQIQRQKEQVLRDDLWEMRHAIDKYKDAADRHAFETSIDSFGYPPDLDTLVNGVDVQGHTVRFLREIPVDPMTGKKDWVLRSMQDDPDSDSWGGQNVFDAHSASDGTALNGTKYNTW